MGRDTNFVWFLIFLVFGLYFINSAILYYKVPDKIVSFDKWIRLVGGALIILGGIHYMRLKSNHKRAPPHN